MWFYEYLEKVADTENNLVGDFGSDAVHFDTTFPKDAGTCEEVRWYLRHRPYGGPDHRDIIALGAINWRRCKRAEKARKAALLADLLSTI